MRECATVILPDVQCQVGQINTNMSLQLFLTLIQERNSQGAHPPSQVYKRRKHPGHSRMINAVQIAVYIKENQTFYPKSCSPRCLILL